MFQKTLNHSTTLRIDSSEPFILVRDHRLGSLAKSVDYYQDSDQWDNQIFLVGQETVRPQDSIVYSEEKSTKYPIKNKRICLPQLEWKMDLMPYVLRLGVICATELENFSPERLVTHHTNFEPFGNLSSIVLEIWASCETNASLSGT